MVRITLALLCLLLLAAAPLRGGTASVRLDSADAYLGSTIQLQVVISDAAEWDPPEIPPVAGLDIERRSGGTSRSIRVVNGRRTEQTQITYIFSISATAPGTYELPSFPILVDGESFRTNPETLTFRRSANNGLLRAEVSGNPATIFQGESTTLTLKIMARQFTDDRLRNGGLDEGDTWNQIRPESEWGPFTESVRELYNSGRRPRGRLQTLQGEGGIRERYWLYEIEAKVRPTSTGPLDVSDVRLVMDYPLSLRQQRGFFNTGLQIGQARPVTATATCRDVEVLPLPTTDRPDLFNGAVGDFTIATTASPTEVAVGDPITLVVTISDEQSAANNLDILPAPELDRVKALEADFRVPREALAGVVAGRQKTFTQTIRARDAGVIAIPPIPYVFFNPATRRYQTVESQPIPVQVAAAETITSADLVGGDDSVRTPDDLGSVAGGLLANYTGANRLLRQQRPPGLGLVLIMVIGPPILVLAVVLFRGMRGDKPGDHDRLRARHAGRSALAALEAISNAPESECGARIIAAVCTYVADRVGEPAAGYMRGDALIVLKRWKVSPNTLATFDTVVGQAERLQYAPSGDHDRASLIRSAQSLIAVLEQCDDQSGQDEEGDP